MIAHLTGILSSKSPDHCIIDVGGVGYRVHISLTTFSVLPEVGEKLTLVVYTHVREDQFLLYGFSTTDERALFQRLINISGVGPKTALTIFSGIPPNQLVEAITTEDRARLSMIPGVGKKTAERIIVDLKDRLAREFPSPVSGGTTQGQLREDVVSALVNLGYRRQVAENALRDASLPEAMPIEDAIRTVLKELCRV